ncbi:MAG: hypothetical protein IPG34_16055 [Rhodocyclaceae bacterium]|nr:hypothetical protein [Rhodocyclaceae bacterium]
MPMPLTDLTCATYPKSALVGRRLQRRGQRNRGLNPILLLVAITIVFATAVFRVQAATTLPPANADTVAALDISELTNGVASLTPQLEIPRTPMGV